MRRSRLWIVVPAQAFDRGKSRLASVLDAPGRRKFSRECFRRVVGLARHLAGPTHTLVVSRAAEVLGLARRLGVRTVREGRPGLNSAVLQAAGFAKPRGARGMVVLHSDLPLLNASDVRSVFRAMTRHRGAVLAPDRDHEGTNALGLRPLRKFRFQFGPDSFDKHRSEARRWRIQARVLENAGIAQDIDTPEQYRRYAASAPALRALSRPT